MWLRALTFCLTGSFLLGSRTYPYQEVLPVSDLTFPYGRTEDVRRQFRFWKAILINLTRPQARSNINEVCPVYKEIKEGTEKLTGVVIKVSGETFRSNIQTYMGEKDAIRDLRNDVGEMHKHFKTAHTQMDKIRKSNQNKYMASKQKLAYMAYKFQLAQNEVSQATSRLRNNEKQLRDSELYYKEAKAEYEHAKKKEAEEYARYRAAKREADHWHTVCMATVWIPFVNIGTCVKYDAEVGDYNNAVYRLQQRSDNLQKNSRLKREAEDRTKEQKERLTDKQSEMSNLIEKRKTLENNIKYLEIDNKFYANSVKDLQILNTEIDVIFSRSKGTFDYTQFGTSVEAFIEKHENLENHLKAHKDLLRVDEKTLAAISKSLAETKEAVKILKERNQSYFF